MIAKGRQFTFLVKFLSEIFQTWSKAKILDINDNYIMEMHYKPNDLVFDVGQAAEVFYILREGTLAHETIIEQETNLKFPDGTKSWQVMRKTKTIQYHIRDLNTGDYFGHEEILTDKKWRQTRVKCLTRATVLQINKVDLLE